MFHELGMDFMAEVRQARSSDPSRAGFSSSALVCVAIDRFGLRSVSVTIPNEIHHRAALVQWMVQVRPEGREIRQVKDRFHFYALTPRRCMKRDARP